MQPSAKTSARASTPPASFTCSGAMYAGVPIPMPARVFGPSRSAIQSLTTFAMPKSATFGAKPSGRGDIRMLSGFRSRCTRPRSCA
jgi:hypothetical protein